MLDADNAAFIQSGVSISLAAAGPGRQASMSRGYGCKLVAGGRQVAVFIKRSQSAELLANIEYSGRVANVFSLPSSHRTLQLKGADARTMPFDADDAALIDAHIRAFVDEVLPLGLREEVVRAVFAYTVDDLVTVVYTPAEAYSQTPGPRAGHPLEARP